MDCTFKTELGKFNYRVGAIIINGSKVLMVRNPNEKKMCYYSVGGRVMFGETLDDAIKREIKEETGIDCEIDRLACLHENFFEDENGVPYHEISVYFTVKPSEALLSIENGRLTKGGPKGEYLQWIDINDCGNKSIYPEFFKTTDFNADKEIKHFVTNDMQK